MRLQEGMIDLQKLQITRVMREGLIISRKMGSNNAKKRAKNGLLVFLQTLLRLKGL